MSSNFLSVWLRLWNARNLAKREIASLAAFVANVFGITSNDSAKAATANCSRLD